jgi:3-oxoacyl-[acyl-carrier protein] reductase
MRKKRALITGSTRGIGKAIYETFLSDGYDVMAPSHSVLDLSNPDSIAGYIESSSSKEIDVLVNNAGINQLALLSALSDENLNETLQVNLKAPIMLVKGFAPGMIKRGYGRIVNISSIWGVIAKAGRLSYTASKSALIGITRTMAIELAPYNVLVNAVCPGFIDTDLTRKNLGQNGIKEVQKQIPLGRLATAGEIATLVHFLCSERNTYVTGQAIVADGGYSIQ